MEVIMKVIFSMVSSTAKDPYPFQMSSIMRVILSMASTPVKGYTIIPAVPVLRVISKKVKLIMESCMNRTVR